jgi:hypothetical protein
LGLASAFHQIGSGKPSPLFLGGRKPAHLRAWKFLGKQKNSRRERNLKEAQGDQTFPQAQCNSLKTLDKAKFLLDFSKFLGQREEKLILVA